MRTLLPIVLGGLALAGGAQAQDPEAGRQVAGMCRTCHGLDGFARIPMAPHIGGEPASYLAAQLRAFRSGERRNEMMNVVAASLSDAQIADVAAWYAAHTVSATLEADPDAAPELCSACHGADGVALLEDMPNLTGEDAFYIVEQLAAFRSGERVNEVMNDVAAELSDEEMRAVADWYAATTLEVEEAETGG